MLKNEEGGESVHAYIGTGLSTLFRLQRRTRLRYEKGGLPVSGLGYFMFSILSFILKLISGAKEKKLDSVS